MANETKEIALDLILPQITVGFTALVPDGKFIQCNLTKVSFGDIVVNSTRFGKVNMTRLTPFLNKASILVLP